MESAIHGPAVKTARETRKLSQTEVANAVGLNRVYYSLFEAGRYVLDLDEQKRVSAFLSGQGIQRADVTARPPPANDRSAAPPKKVSQDEAAVPSQGSGDYADALLASASRALRDLRDAAEASSIDSKRIAGLVSAASEVLQSLDYVELLATADDFEAPLDGLPSRDEFAALPLSQKELWETRIAGLLICAALYGDDWQKATCKDFERIAPDVRNGVTDEQWNVRGRSILETLFDDAEKFRPRYRCEFAPHIARAAAERRAPVLRARGSSAHARTGRPSVRNAF